MNSSAYVRDLCGRNHFSPRRAQGNAEEIFSSKFVDHALDAFLQVKDVEVDQEPDLHSAQLQIGQQLRLMNRNKFCHGLRFNDEAIFNQNVER